MTAYEALEKKYQLEASLTGMQERYEELRDSLPELIFRKREAQEAALNAGGGLQRFLSRLAGKGEDDREDLDRAVRTAAAALEAAQRETSAMKERCSRIKQESADLGEKAELMNQLTEAERAHFLRLEASLCAEGALHYLRKCRKELSAAQDLARTPMMGIGDGHRENVHKANAGALADKCRKKLEEINACGFAFDIHPYIANPMGYIVTAMPYGDQDRMNSAQKGIRETEAALKELLLQLVE